MSPPRLIIGRIERRLSTGNSEDLTFQAGVNLLVGRPNTGKTKWLQTLDYLLGDTGNNPFEGAVEEGLADKYDSAAVELFVGEERFWVERRWRDPGAKTKVFVDDVSMSPREFQHLLMKKLGIPLLNFPKGNPMSGQTWPELTFRILMRHIYRQQRFWGGLADLQPDGEQHASLLQFLGLAEHIFTEEYGNLIKLKMEVETLKSRRDQYGTTLDELARDVLSEPGISVGANATTVRQAQDRIAKEIEAARLRRSSLIISARDQIVSSKNRPRVDKLGEERASLLVELEQVRLKSKETSERAIELQRYKDDLNEEINRMSRAEDAGDILADLRITHCPACDQHLSGKAPAAGHCFMCHQTLPDEPVVGELGAVRLRFEKSRVEGEAAEAADLLRVVKDESKHLTVETASLEERLKMIENELAPARQAVSSLVQEEISANDMALGELNERQRQLGRVFAALELGQKLTDQIADKERAIEPLESHVDEIVRRTDFDAAATSLEDGMNSYLSAINQLRPGVWRHSAVTVDLSRWSFTIRIGARRWGSALGGTDTLYFLMAYHYALVTLSKNPAFHYPGVSITDVPGEFSGEAIEDKENFIVQPFIDLLASPDFEDAQVIITGASFAGLAGTNRLHLQTLYVA